MEQATDDLIGSGFDSDDALSLTGRALFLRFLMDRKVITSDNLNDVCPKADDLVDCLSNVHKADLSNRWLDDIFNGDLLPISQESISKLLKNLDERKRKWIFTVLTLILKKAEPAGAGKYQTRLSWEDLDFAHVPVGLLSQVYERHCHKYDSYAKQTSVHYTPRNIAEYMVDQVFSNLKNNHQVKVLDPAAGAGVFLVICFRKLVENWWKKTGKRPDRVIIREKILYMQIKGFDINDPALTLAAFSLYLTAIELDPDPTNLKDMKFEKLIGKVLFDMRSPDEKDITGPVLGSLNLQNSEDHKGAYDIVIGNPPWTALTKEHEGLKNQFHTLIRKIANERGLINVAKDYHNPDGVHDLPFVWCATHWCKEGGRISFALHSRLLFKNSNFGVKARNALFSALKITGILNGSYLRKTEVWPNVDSPFCLLFAENKVPDANSLFTYISPELESNINNKEGRFRIDSKSAQPIQLSCLVEKPTLLKTLFRGTSLDVQVIDKIIDMNLMTVKDYWDGKHLKHGQGYQIAGGSKPVKFLKRYRNLTTENAHPFFINPDELPKFDLDNLHRERDQGIYKGPMLIARQCPNSDRNESRAMICLTNVSFNESFYSYIGYGHPNDKEIVKYLFLLLHSDLFLYYALMASGVFGVERERIYKEDIDNFPIRPIEKLTDDELRTINELTDKLITEEKKPWSRLDRFVCKIYNLNEFDQEVIRDTLSVNLPFSESKKRAQETPTKLEIEQFAERLENDLRPFYEIVGKQINVKILGEFLREGHPWVFLKLGDNITPEKNTDIPEKRDMTQIMKMADDWGASRILIKSASEPLVMGILKQYRYWTPTRARLTALELLKDRIISDY